MAQAIEADLVVAHLGPAALESQAVMSTSSALLCGSSRAGRPIVVLVPHGIGETREEIDTMIAGRLPYSAQATWAPTPEPAASAGPASPPRRWPGRPFTLLTDADVAPAMARQSCC